MKSTKKRLCSFILSFALVASLLPQTALIIPAEAASSTSGSIGVADDDVLIKDTVTDLAPGVVEHEVVTNSTAGDDQKIDYLCEVDMTQSVKIVAGYGDDYSADNWELVKTTTQAAAYEAATGEKVVAAINADFFNMATGEPMGALVMGGTEEHAISGRNYFAILTDGTAVIRDSSVPLTDVQEAVGGDVIILKDGVVQSDANSTYGSLDYSRTAIGIKADGTVVTFTTYGRLYPVSCGRTYEEIAEMLLACGCVDALALDGGGSSTLAVRPEGSDSLSVCNSPSDGAEREVSSTLLIVSTEESTGVFDHAVVTPNNEVYTPGSTVTFEANGSDKSGAAVDLPDDLTWALADDSTSLGTIDASTGVFTAGETAGTVTVELKQGDTVVGSTTIDIATPDLIYFSSEEVSLGFEESTDLGLVVRSEGRDMNYNSGDIVWTMTDENLGTFTDNTFTSSDGESLNGDITATSKWDDSVSGTIHVIVGMLPTIVWDFEDYEVTDEDGNVTETIAAEDYYVNGYTTTAEDGTETTTAGILTHSNYGRGGSESIEIVDIDADEPVRFGSHSLKLNYDFTQCGAVTEGACIGTTDSMTIPGTPTAIGVWVYAPEGVGITYTGSGSQAGFWLRGYVKDSAGNTMPYDFTLEPKACIGSDGNWNGVQPGIYWEGWMYCEADLTKLSAPFSIQSGMTFRLMYVDGTKMGTKTAGSIYFDNLQFVYGTNVDDVDNPVIDSITANNTELEDGAVLDTNTVTFDSIFHDVENKYTTGIDTSTIRMYIDGVNVVDNDSYEYAADPDGTRNHLYNVYLLNGQHSITVSIRDGFGNETSETRYFTVAGEEDASIPTITVKPSGDTAYICDTVSVEVRASDASQVSASSVSLNVGTQFTDYEVTFSDNYEGTYEYKNLSKTLIISATRKESASSDDNLIATVTYKVPETLTSSAEFTWTVKSGSYTVGETQYTFCAPEDSIPVGAMYTVSADPILTGQSGTIQITTESGEAASGVSLYYVGDTDELVGTSDENGSVTTELFSTTAGKYTVYAKDTDGRLSFRASIISYDAAGEDGMPYDITNNATANPTTEKEISWMSSPVLAGTQYLEYAPTGTDNWTKVAADTELQTFTTGTYTAANVNSVKITGLSANTTYDYRVGDGTNVSDVQTFTTGKVKDKTSFFVLGDIQAEDLTNINSLMALIREKNYDFGIQTGDAVDDPTKYSDWTDVLGLFGTANLGDTDVIHVLGNHEYAGDADASTAAAIYGLPVTGAGSYYSVTYGNVYVAVINYTGNTVQLREALAWLKEDAAGSDALWKVLTIHQPAYYTNTVGGNAEIHALVPSAAEEAGIDMVFSGHDHSYARTEPLTGGEVDEENGIVYFICGSSGEKSYTVTDNEDFHFAKLSSDYNGIYLGVSTTRSTMTVNVYETDGSIIDTYTMTREDPCAKDHTAVRQADGSIVCSVCGEELTEYTGFVTDAATGGTMYFLNGVMQTGWVLYGSEYLHFGTDGMQHEVTMTNVPTTCLVQGAKTYTCACGSQKVVKNSAAPGHEYVEQENGSYVCSVCGYTRVELEDCTITIPYTSYTYSGTAKKPYPTVVAPDGTTLQGGSVDFYVNWKNNTDVGTGQVIITAKSGYNVNLTDYRGNYGGQVTVEFNILPKAPTDVEVAETTSTTATLTWTDPMQDTDSAASYSYRVYKKNTAGVWKLIGTTTDTTFTVSGLECSTSYDFAVRTVGTVDSKDYVSLGYVSTSGTTAEGADIADCTGTLAYTYAVYNGYAKTPGVTITTADGTKLVKGTDYTIAYADNVNVGTATVTVTGKGGYTGTLTLTYTIAQQSLIHDKVVVTAENAVYTGQPIETAVTVTDRNGIVLTEGTDYTVSYTNNVNAGTATATVTGMGNYKSSASTTFTISTSDISGLSAALAADQDLTYTGSEVTPEVVVEDLIAGTDYTVTYADNVNVGTATATVTGTGNYAGSIELTYEVVAADIANATIADGSTYTYTGSAIIPDLDVTSEAGILEQDKDYQIVSYENNVEVGTATVTIRGIGNYTGTTTHDYQIQRSDLSAFAVSLDPGTTTYDGTAKEPLVFVSTANRMLTEDKDYTVEYVNNTNAGTATVIVTGIGSYTGTAQRSFTIAPIDITDYSAELAWTKTTYTGAEMTPEVTIEGLTADTDYTVTYEDNVNVGTATVTVTGIGNYTGSIELTYEIEAADIATAKITDKGEYIYTGSAITPDFEVTSTAGVLEQGKDYKIVSYENNVNVGTATMTIQGIGNYTGTAVLEYQIQSCDLSAGVVELDPEAAVYNGKAQEPAVTVSLDERVLTAGTDYTVAYTDNINVGTATVTVTGKGGYSGTLQRTFVISKADITACSVELPWTQTTYSGTEKKPVPTVTTADGTKLVEGTDYTVAYANNENAGTATVTITGKGGYAGEVQKTFEISKADVKDCNVKLSWTKTTYSGTAKRPTPTVTTADGVKLVKGTDYTVAYADNKNAGTATVTITGKGNYTGTLTTTFTIKKANLSKCTLTLQNTTFYATGEAAEPGVTVKTAKGTVLVEGENYTVSYANNTEAGTATVTVTGIGNYSGTLTKTFTIKSRIDIAKSTATLSWTKTTYTGTEKRPGVTVKTANGTTLKKGTNYTVEYSNNVEAGIATVTITGIGKYTGTITKNFTIRPVKPTNVSATATKTTIKVSFDRHDSADKYYIYLDGKYKGCTVTKDYYTIKGLTAGTTHEVSVKAVKEVNGKMIYSLMSSSVSVTTKE